ncbi:sigma-70 family RNA polymerase sigma factor [Clostridium niameyense]|uniref:sigma-70 family RNA polymerase sigma factor n=1 Tax=Clostridium niameyense TaxID=1622073 RepID=UPI00067ECE34|nr:sigma-70 family RNA polymerase sigma factor [Clostridium niameyense]
MNIDDNNFITEIQKRNSKALQYIVDKYINLIFKVVSSVLNSNFHNQFVEECVNDIFLSIWNNIDSFDINNGNFKNWITAIAKYKAIDYKRKLFKEYSKSSLDDYRNSLSNKNTTEDLIISKENKYELLKEINNMKPKDKEIFIRRYFLHDDIENIAKILGTNRNCIDKKLSRGRKFLKEKLRFLKGEIF